MTNEEKRLDGLMRIRRMRFIMIIGYGLIVLAAVVGITLFSLQRNETVMKEKVSSMASSLNVQMKLKLDEYLSRLESQAALAFSVENVYTYDAANEKNDEYEAINIEKQIDEELKKFCLMDNFVDYGIVYSNNHTVGKISNGTTKLFGNKMYSDLHSMITRERTHDGWCYGYNDDFNRIYYVKKINEGAVFVISFYTSELEHVFYNPDSVDDMVMRLSDRYYRIIYSSNSSEMGTTLPDDVIKHVLNHDVLATIDDSILTAAVRSEVEWYVVSTMPTDTILKESHENRKYSFIVAGLVAFIAIVAGALFAFGLSDPVANIASNLDGELRDEKFEGVLNGRFFTEKVKTILNRSLGREHRALVLVEIDDFQNITCTFGRDYSDEQVARLVNGVKDVFPNSECIGRISENTLGILTGISTEKEGSLKMLMSKRCLDVCNGFRTSARADNGYVYKISASIGVSFTPEHGSYYQHVYDAAYKALYSSKVRGGGNYTIYDDKIQ